MWNGWRNDYGRTKADRAERLRELESVNARTRMLLAEAELGKAMLMNLT